MEGETGDWADEAEQRVLDKAIELAPDLGWNARLVRRAAKAAGLSAGEAMLLLPNSARDLAALLSRRHDQAALAALDSVDPSGLKVRERIHRSALARLDAAVTDEAAVQRCAAFLALPANLPLAGRLLWESADVLWRWAGDASTDENHYSKRVILSEILGASLAVALHQGRDAAEETLSRGIDAVMAFERWKAKLKPPKFGRDLAEALGRARYGR